MATLASGPVSHDWSGHELSAARKIRMLDLGALLLLEHLSRRSGHFAVVFGPSGLNLNPVEEGRLGASFVLESDGHVLLTADDRRNDLLSSMRLDSGVVSFSLRASLRDHDPLVRIVTVRVSWHSVSVS